MGLIAQLFGSYLGLEIILALVLSYFIINEVIRYQARIRGLNGPPGPPLIGNLYQTYQKHTPEIFRKWAQDYGDVFQIQLGNVPVVIINSAASAKELLQEDSHAFISRPIFHTFHKIVSGSQGFSIGTSPWDDSCKRRRKAAATALNRPKVDSYVYWLDTETAEFIKNIWQISGKEHNDIKPAIHRLSLNLVLTVNYGDRISEGSEDVMKEIKYVEDNISKYRETNGNLKNYIPLLRLWQWDSTSVKGKEIGAMRQAYNGKLLNQLYERVKKNTDKPCIQGNIIKDPDAKLNFEEMYSISISMMAGADSSTPTMQWIFAYLGSHPEIQQKAYESILEQTGGDESKWPDPADYNNAYVKAIVYEVSRYFSVLRLSLPRATFSDVIYRESKIPAQTPVFLNTWACNHDPDLYEDPWSFRLERWFDDELTQKKKENGLAGLGVSHFAFGVGGRMCPASYLANRTLYMTTLRAIWSFKISEPLSTTTGEVISLDPLAGMKSVTSNAATPQDYKIKLVARNARALEKLLEKV